MKTTEEWLIENAGMFTTKFMLALHQRESEIHLKSLKSAASIALHHAKCHESRGNNADKETKEICNIEAEACRDIAQSIYYECSLRIPNMHKEIKHEPPEEKE